MKTFRSHPLRRGFTLVELLIAMAITTIIASILISVTVVAVDSWNRSRAELRAARQAKFMVDSIAKDFESLVTRRGNKFEWLSAKTAAPLPGSDRQKSSNASKLIFFTAATDRYEGKISTPDDKGGDVSCVAYDLQFKDPIDGGNGNFSTFTLNRLLVNPDQAFGNLLGQTELEPAFLSYQAQMIDLKNFVCENIFQYSVTFHVEVTKNPGTTKASIVSVPVSLGPTVGSGRVIDFRILGSGIELAESPSADVTIDELKAGRVAAVEISLTVISDFGMLQLRGERNLIGNAMIKFMAKNSFQYSKRVELPCM
ncbi:MAG: prepilin-type N-terminal cleavage/methylation domain-containing protein [Verrucomicrobia bacterium]|nr:MAG: prepilin-type N-terminal cleavage/methylation domain-containing protein [Verrucomicrobiota bacterium]